MRRRMIALAAVALVLSACGAARPVSTVQPAGARASGGCCAVSSGGPGLVTLKVANAPSTIFSMLYVAMDKGYLKQQGIQVDLQVVTSGQDAIALLGNGQLDAIAAGLTAGAFTAINQGLDVRIVSSVGYGPNGNQMVLRSDEMTSVRTASDLRGKKIGVTGGLGGTGSYLTDLVLAKGGLSLKDVDLRSLPFPEQVLGLKNKSIDAAFPVEPFSTELLSGHIAEVPEFGRLPDVFGTSAMMYGPRLLRQDRALGNKLMTALVMGARDLQGSGTHTPENLEILAKYTKLSAATINAIDPILFRTDLAPFPATYEGMQRAFITEGQLKFAQPLPAERLIDGGFTSAAVSQLT